MFLVGGSLTATALCFIFSDSGKIKKLKAGVGVVEIETHEVNKEPEFALKNQAKEPELQETEEEVIEEEIKDTAVKKNLAEDGVPPDFKRTDNAFYDLSMAGYLHKDVQLVEKCVKRLANEKEWNEEHTKTYLYDFLQETGLEDGISKLKGLEEKHNNWFLPSLSLARYYVEYKALDKALEKVDVALERASTPKDKLTVKIKKAQIVILRGDKDQGLEILQGMLKETDEIDEKVRIFTELADYYKSEDDKDSEAYYLEAMLKVNPDTTHIRFRLAYLYSQNLEPLMAVYHYSILVNQDEDYNSAYNNLGVSYGKLKLKNKQIFAWKSGHTNKEAHPTGNLALALAEKGFFEEAEKYLDEVGEEAQKEERIIAARSFIQTKREEEETRLEEVEKSADKLHRFYEKQALLQVKKDDRVFLGLNSLRGTWIDGDKTLKIEERDGGTVGVLITLDKRYSVKINKTGTMVFLDCKQTHYKPQQSALGGFGAVLGGMFPTLPPKTDEDGWAKSDEGRASSYLLADTFKLKLFLTSSDVLEGYKLKTHTEQEHIRFVR